MISTRPICRIRPKNDAKPPRPAEQAVAEQHAEEAGAEEAGREPAEQSPAG